MRYVSLEARFGWTEAAWKALVATAPSSWKLRRERLSPKESHESMGMLGMYLGLRDVFSDYSRFAAPVSPTTSILPYYAKVSASLGASVIPPRKLLQNVVEDLLMEGRGAAAREAYNTLVSGYGAPADSAHTTCPYRRGRASAASDGVRRGTAGHAISDAGGSACVHWRVGGRCVGEI